MKLLVVAVGQRMPDWAQTAWDDYAKRFPPELKLELRAVKTEPRGSKTLDTLYAAERERIEAAIAKGMRIVALDERGTSLTTKALATRLQNWQLEGDDVALVIGGPDGLDPAFKAAAHERIRLSDLTLPHAMARVLLVEQLYRAWSVNAGHPYHREGATCFSISRRRVRAVPNCWVSWVCGMNCCWPRPTRTRKRSKRCCPASRPRPTCSA